MSDMVITKVKVKADSADDATRAAKAQARDQGLDVRGAYMPVNAAAGEWEVDVIVAELKKAPAKKAAPKKAAPKKAAPKKAAASDEPEEKSGWFGKKKSE